MHKQPEITKFPFRRRPAARKCYACDAAPVGFALRDIDGGPALGDTVATSTEVHASPRTVRRPACARHAWPAKWIRPQPRVSHSVGFTTAGSLCGKMAGGDTIDVREVTCLDCKRRIADAHSRAAKRS